MRPGSAGQALWRVCGEQGHRARDQGFQVQRFGQLRQDRVQHFGFVGGDFEQLCASREDDDGEKVDGYHGFLREQEIKQASYVAVFLDIVRI